MKSATEQLIELAERLNPTGVIGDHAVAEFHALAARARVEITPKPRPPCAICGVSGDDEHLGHCSDSFG